MTEADTQNGQGTEDGTPEDQNQQKTPEQIAEENRILKEQIAERDKRLSDKDRHIGQLSTEKETLEKRVQSTNVKTEDKSSEDELTDEEIDRRAQEIAELQVEDPALAAKKNAQLMKDIRKASRPVSAPPPDIEGAIDRISYAKEVQKANQDLMDLGFEPVVTTRANQLMAAGKSFKEAVDTAISECREKVKPLLKTPEKDNMADKAPAGSQGESDSSSQSQQKVEKKYDKKDVDISSVDARQARMMASGL